MGYSTSGILGGLSAVDVFHLLCAGAVGDATSLRYQYDNRCARHPQLKLVRLNTKFNATDSRAHLPPAGGENLYIKHAKPDAIPEMYDIPIGMVNRVIYGRRRNVGVEYEGAQSESQTDHGVVPSMR